MRADLLALDADDLAELTSRGAVKRARRELDAGAPTVVVEEADDGTVLVKAEDGTVVTLPPGVPVEEASCTCAAVGCCRHVARAVLAYTVADEPPVREAWDPGELDDAVLEAALRPAALKRGWRLVAGGLTVTVVRSAKPMAVLHDAGVAVRFLVPGELSYARCDCVDAPPCEHVVAAVAAFREVAAESGVVVLGATPAAPSSDVLARVRDALDLLAEAGVASGRDAVPNALAHAEHACRSAGLPWLADVAAELADLCVRHARGDGTFVPVRAAQLVGEMVLRTRSLQDPGSAVPQLFAGGPRRSADTSVGGGRLVGIGTLVRDVGIRTDVDALVYDPTTRRLLALGRTYETQQADGSPPPYSQLAQGTLQRGVTIAGAGAGQIVATGGRHSPGGRLKLGRRPAGLSAQGFEWQELLRAPVLVDGIAEARAIAGVSFPLPLGPRTAGAGIVVLGIGSIETAGFHGASGTVVARATDTFNEPVVIAHPFTGRAAQGTERLLSRLLSIADGEGAVRFVAGMVRTRGAETEIAPIGVVVEDPNGHRELLQPWVDTGDTASARSLTASTGEVPPGEPEVAQLLDDVQQMLGSLLVAGIARADRGLRDLCVDTSERCARLGSTAIAPAAERLSQSLAARAHDAHWEPGPSVAAAIDLAAMVELARTI